MLMVMVVLVVLLLLLMMMIIIIIIMMREKRSRKGMGFFWRGSKNEKVLRSWASRCPVRDDPLRPYVSTTTCCLPVWGIFLAEAGCRHMVMTRMTMTMLMIMMMMKRRRRRWRIKRMT